MAPELEFDCSDGAPQLSVAVGAVHVATWLHDVLPGPVYTVIFCGQLLMTGGVLSTTVTVKLQVLVLLCESVAVYITVVVPAGNVAPEL